MADLLDNELVLAVDLGANKIITALVSPRGEIVDREYMLTLAEDGTWAVIDRILGVSIRFLPGRTSCLLHY